MNVSHSFDRDTLSLKTSTTKAPKFEIKTKRFQSKFDVKASIQDPKLEINLSQKREKYALDVDSTYDWSTHNCDGELAVSYSGIDRLLLGTKVKVTRSASKQTTGVSDYNVGLQFNRNKDQTFAVTTYDMIYISNAKSHFECNIYSYIIQRGSINQS